jgi:hypothetical protein
MEAQTTPNNQYDPEQKESNAESIAISNLKLYYTVIVTKMA